MLNNTIATINEELMKFNRAFALISSNQTSLSDKISNTLSQIANDLSDELALNADNIKKVQAFISIASSHTMQRNTVNYAEPFDIVELSRLSILIDSTNPYDGNASMLYSKAQAQLNWLNSNNDKIVTKYKRKEEAVNAQFQKEKEALSDQEVHKAIELTEFLNSDKVGQFIIEAKRQFDLVDNNDVLTADNTFIIGKIKVPASLSNRYSSFLTTRFGKLYEASSNSFIVPYNLDISLGEVFYMEYMNSNENNTFSFFQRIIYNAKDYSNAFDQIAVFDPIRYNNSCLGVLSPLSEGANSFIDKVSTSKEDVQAKLQAILNKFRAEEDTSNFRLNSGNKKLLIFHDFPNGYDNSISTQIQQLCVNANRYGLIIIVTNNIDNRKSYMEDYISYIKQFAKQLVLRNNEYYLRGEKLNDDMKFELFSAPTVLSDNIKNILMAKQKKNTRGNNYKDRVGYNWNYQYKGKRMIKEIPFSIDEDESIQYLDFTKTNSSTFICGSPRSGKSNLLHVILTGIFKSYHPDDVEVWLIDFGMTEFSAYTDPTPRHIRYLILDESPELVYDVIDRLTVILNKRQNYFKGNNFNISYEIPKERYFPAVFVMIDEFPIMAKIIAESSNYTNDNYKDKLEKLLQLGPKFGFVFIFSSQGYEEGVRGLTDYARSLIQQRIAMKTTLLSEVKDTLAIKNLTESDNSKIQRLPIYHALTVSDPDEYGNRVIMSKVLNASEKEEKAKRKEMIVQINDYVNAAKIYEPDDCASYINKKPLAVDGNLIKSYYSESKAFNSIIDKKFDQSEVSLFIGEPKRLAQYYGIEVSNTYCENFLIVSPIAETMACTSILLSMYESLSQQDWKVSVLSHSKDKISKQIARTKMICRSSSQNLDEVCAKIKEIKEKIENGIQGNEFYYLLGFATLINEMSFIEGSASVKSTDITADYEPLEVGELDLLEKLALGLSPEQKKPIDKNTEAKSIVKEEKDMAYDARDDLKFILTQGPRLGYHFVIVFNSSNEVEMTKTNTSLFNHKILFKMSVSSAREIVGSLNSQVVPQLLDRNFRYFSGTEAVSFRPYLHYGLSWDDWTLDSSGNAIKVDNEEEYLM